MGRSREIGITTHLLREGLEGRLALVRIAGAVGIGRRRLLAEALRQGPDAEWIQLAPGGGVPDFKRWTRTELHDLLESYPSAPVPSWALHVLSRWSPPLGQRAPVPALSREAIPETELPDLLGRAIGAVLRSLTGHTPVIVDAGLWVDRGPNARTLLALTQSLKDPGAVVLTAADTPKRPDGPGERTLLLGPLEREDLGRLLEHWRVEPRSVLAAWLHRVTGGNPFYIHETVRWLEETGHVRVIEEEGRLEFLDAPERLPIPMNLASIMELRYRRLPPEAAKLFALIAQFDSNEDIETFRASMDEDDIFSEGLSWLRRREFLYRRSTRRPLALASPLWRSFARAGTFRLRYEADPWMPPPEESPLAKTVALLDALARDHYLLEDVPALHVEIARAVRRARGRPGPAWDGVRGRAAFLAARRRLVDRRSGSAARWVRWGLSHLDPEVQPNLRRALAELGARAQEALGHPREAQVLREMAWLEARAAGHEVAAGRLEGVVAEGARRLGEIPKALTHAAQAVAAGQRFGLSERERLAEYTRISAYLDIRHFEATRTVLDSLPPALRGLAARREGLESEPRRFERILPDPEAIPRGWGWGLDEEPGWRAALRRSRVALESSPDAFASEVILAKELERLESAGYLGLAADFAEARLFAALAERGAQVSWAHLGDPVRILRTFEDDRRLRLLAETLRDTRAAAHSLFPDLYAPYLLSVVGEPPRASEPPLRLWTTGLVRLEQGTYVWPRALWPEWWALLWGEAMSAIVLGTSLPRELLEARLQDVTDLPRVPLEALLHQANEMLRGAEPVLAGLELRGGMVGVEWDGFTSDVREIADLLRALRSASDPTAARSAAIQALHQIRGEFLPGLESPGIMAARDTLRAGVTEALDLALQGEPPVAEVTSWLEGPTRLIGAPAYSLLREFMNRCGKARTAHAIPHGSP